jgi:hypothetical protein
LVAEVAMYLVRVADNFHYMDEAEHNTHGTYSTWPEAVAAARSIVDRNLAEYIKPGMTAEELLANYRSFGDDPFIVPSAEDERFSAWDYAKERCADVCGK